MSYTPKNTIDLCLAHMSDEGLEQKYVTEAFCSNWVAPLGPNVNAFEEDIKSFVESVAGTTMEMDGEITRWPAASWAQAQHKEVVALSSGTAALHLALLCCGVVPGDEVVCQSFTFCASCNPIKYLGATPVFVDSELDTWNMDPCLLEVAIKDRIAKTGKKPKAIVLVHLYGMPAKIDSILEVARRYDITVVEDAAESLGSRYKGRALGTFGRYGVLSFNGNKMITTSGGGTLICPDMETKQRVLFFATQAREPYPYYQHEEIGYNYRLSNVCAGIGRGQMTVLDGHIAHHRMLARFYKEAFASVPGITFHENPSPDIDSNYWLNTITISPALKVKGEENVYKGIITGTVGGSAGHAAKYVHTDCEPNPNVEAMRLVLDQAGIESRPLWKPMHRQPVWSSAPAYVNGISETVFATGLCLPSGPLVTFEDACRIVDIIKSAITGLS